MKIAIIYFQMSSILQNLYIFARNNQKKQKTMKKSILLLAVAMWLGGSLFAQNKSLPKAVNTALTFKGERLKKTITNLTKALGDTVYYESFDGNALPSGWDTTNYVSHWEFANVAEIKYATDQEQPKDAWLKSPAITIADSVANPVLMFDVSTSYYWLVGNNTDDVTVLVSTDGGTTWSNPIWKEDDSTLVLNSLMPWPYTSFEWYTAKINLSAYVGQTIRIAFHYKSNDGVGGHNGVSFYMDNFTVRDDYTQDLDLVATLPMSYGSYWYGVQSKRQSWPYTVFRGLVLNYGASDINTVNFDISIKDENDNVVFNQTVNSFVSGASSIASHATDTLEWSTTNLTQAFQPDTTVNHAYTISFNLTSDPTDQDMSNNTGEWSMVMTDSLFGRSGTPTSTLSMNDYYPNGGGNEDILGVMLFTKNPDTAQAIKFYNSASTTIGTSVQAKIYELDNQGHWQEKISSDAYDITAADTATWVTVPLLTDGFSEILNGQQWYLVALQFYFDPSSQDIRVGVDDQMGRLYHQHDDAGWKNSVNASIGGQWYYLTEGVPAFLLATTPVHDINAAINTVSMNGLSVYPNPATTTLYVENNTGASIHIYNLLGEEVKVINNADRNAVINVADLNEGTYIVKVIDGNKVKTAKVNIVK